jgi:hypothetical protein
MWKLFYVCVRQVAPVVHQLDHFLEELTALADAYIHAPASTTSTTSGGSAASKKFGADLSARYRPRNSNAMYIDRAWQALAASQCLFDCADSVVF